MNDDKNSKELTEQDIVEALDKDGGNSSAANTKERSKKNVKAVNKKSRLKGLKSEFKRISWPTRKETLNSTISVVVVSVILCVIIACIDYLIQNGLNLVFSIGV